MFSMLEKRFEVKKVGTIGFGEGIGKELQILGRTVRFNDEEDYMEVEADEKHVKQLLIDLGLTKAKGVATPRVKQTFEQHLRDEASRLLNRSEAKSYRSGTMRIAFLAQDRLDLSEATKCLSQHMSNPREAHMPQLKRVARYLISRPRAKII